MNKQQEKSWYLVTSKPKQDGKAEQQLLNQGYEVYRPLAKRSRKRGEKLVTSTESLFPRYIFIRLCLQKDNWGPIRSTIGVQGMVKFGATPAMASDELIDSIKNEEANLSDKTFDLDLYKKDEKVLITEGPFKGLQAVFQNYNGLERVVILLSILEQQTKMTINPVKLR